MKQESTEMVTTNSPPKWRLIVNKLIKISVNMSLVIGAIYLFGMMSTIHGKELPEEYFINGYPSIIGLVDSEIFMGVIFVITLSIFVYALYLFWQLHEVAVHKSQQMSSAHTQIVFALSLCGLFIDKTWWVLAIIIAFARWDVIGNAISSIINNGVRGNKQ
ncbi:magnesium transporter [Shewanella maritima]|uniref:magnesium transporter n=1 Tax=Shewanella maritima TaxID=2520507 RepID=UPI003734CE00